MKMNRFFISTLVATGLMSSGAMAADGTITFTGSVTASACTTVVGAGQTGGSMSSGSATVSLPNVPSDIFTAQGVYAGHTAFSIELAGCEATGALQNVRALFTTASPAVEDNFVMANTAASGAANVGVAILTPSGTQIDLNNGALVDPGAALPTGAASGMTLNYIAAYKSLSASVGQGDVTGVADYVISYF